MGSNRSFAVILLQRCSSENNIASPTNHLTSLILLVYFEGKPIPEAFHVQLMTNCAQHIPLLSALHCTRSDHCKFWCLICVTVLVVCVSVTTQIHTVTCNNRYFVMHWSSIHQLGHLYNLNDQDNKK